MSDSLENKVSSLSLAGSTGSKFNLQASEFVPSWGAPLEKAPIVPSASAPTGKVMSLGSASQLAPVTQEPIVKPVATLKMSSSDQSLKENVEKAVPSTILLEASESIQNMVDEEDTFDVTALGKEHLNIIFIGHVDAGKSTMGGHIL